MSSSLMLYSAASAVCPISGASIGNPNNPATWRLDYQPGATAEQIAAAQQVLAAFSPALATAWAAYQVQAQEALNKSDTTMLRCAENGISVPAAWATYRRMLRAIVAAPSGDPTQPLPVRPAYPPGT